MSERIEFRSQDPRLHLIFNRRLAMNRSAMGSADPFMGFTERVTDPNAMRHTYPIQTVLLKNSGQINLWERGPRQYGVASTAHGERSARLSHNAEPPNRADMDVKSAQWIGEPAMHLGDDFHNVNRIIDDYMQLSWDVEEQVSHLVGVIRMIALTQRRGIEKAVTGLLNPETAGEDITDNADFMEVNSKNPVEIPSRLFQAWQDNARAPVDQNFQTGLTDVSGQFDFNHLTNIKAYMRRQRNALASGTAMRMPDFGYSFEGGEKMMRESYKQKKFSGRDICGIMLVPHSLFAEITQFAQSRDSQNQFIQQQLAAAGAVGEKIHAVFGGDCIAWQGILIISTEKVPEFFPVTANSDLKVARCPILMANALVEVYQQVERPFRYEAWMHDMWKKYQNVDLPVKTWIHPDNQGSESILYWRLNYAPARRRFHHNGFDAQDKGVICYDCRVATS